MTRADELHTGAIAEAIANGETLPRAAKRAGVSSSSARALWARIVARLGWQAS